MPGPKPGVSPERKHLDERLGIPSVRDGQAPAEQCESGSSCFLTSACVEARGLGDDCRELTLLREFRDEVVLRLGAGRQLVDEYYAIAPAVVRAINSRSDSHAIYDRIYAELVQPTIEKIEAGEYEEAVAHYRDFTFRLRAELLH